MKQEASIAFWHQVDFISSFGFIGWGRLRPYWSLLWTRERIVFNRSDRFSEQWVTVGASNTKSLSSSFCIVAASRHLGPSCPV